MPLGASRLNFFTKPSAAPAVPDYTVPTSAFNVDSNTLILLHNDGTNGSTTFTDSAGNYTLSASGNAQLDTGTKQFGTASLELDGTGDYATVTNPDTTLIDWDAGDFTVEAWIYVRDLASTDYLNGSNLVPNMIGNMNPNEGTNYWSFGPVSDGKLSFYYYRGGTDFNYSTSAPITENTWHHIAVTYDSSAGDITFWCDGYNVGTESYLGTGGQSTGVAFTIGAYNNEYFDGFIDEVRISNAVRYPTYTPPTLTYRSDSYSANLELALPFDDLHLYNDVTADVVGSGTNLTPNFQGRNADITDTQVKWTSSPDYGKSHEGIATANQQQMNYTLGTSIPDCNSGSNSYVVEGWFYANDATTNANWCLSSGDVNGRWLFGINSGTTFSFGGENNIGIGSGWHHLAIVLDSGTKRFYYDGIYKGAWSSVNTGFSTLHVGQFNTGDTNDFRGHIQDLRVYVGTNKGYTGTNSSSANFTLPSSIVETYGDPVDDTVATWDGTDFDEITTAFTNDGSTEALISWDGTFGQTSATDESSSSHTITFDGSSAYISDERKRFGTASLDLHFSGTDSVYFGDSGTSNWSTQDTTIECWVYYDTMTGAQASNGLPRIMGSFVTTGGGNYWSFGAKDDGSLQLFWYSGAGNYVTSATGLISAGQWHHIAFTYDNTSNDIELFLDGKNVASGTFNSLSGTHGYIRLGNYSGTPNAHVDEIRVSHTKRYTPVETTSDTSLVLAGGDYGYHPNTPWTTTTSVYSFFTWFYLDSATISNQAFLYESFRNGISAARIDIYQSKIMVNGFNGSNSPIYRAQWDTTLSGDTWYAVWHVVDPTDNTKRHFYVQQYGSSTVTEVTSSNSNFYANLDNQTWQSGFYDTSRDIGIGARGANGAVAMRGKLAEFWMDDVYRDFSSSANRQKFVDSSGYPVDLGSDGSTPFGAAPPIYLAGTTINSANRGDSGSDPTYVGSPPTGGAVGT